MLCHGYCAVGKVRSDPAQRPVCCIGSGLIYTDQSNRCNIQYFFRQLGHPRNSKKYKKQPPHPEQFVSSHNVRQLMPLLLTPRPTCRSQINLTICKLKPSTYPVFFACRCMLFNEFLYFFWTSIPVGYAISCHGVAVEGIVREQKRITRKFKHSRVCLGINETHDTFCVLNT
jgi:hypothetical protein